MSLLEKCLILSDTVPSGPPTNVTATILTPHSVRLTWSQPSPPPLGGVVYYIYWGDDPINLSEVLGYHGHCCVTCMYVDMCYMIYTPIMCTCDVHIVYIQCFSYKMFIDLTVCVCVLYYNIRCWLCQTLHIV